VGNALFGLDEQAAFVYQTAMQRRTGDAALLASWLRWPLPQVQAALATLIDQGLVVTGPGGNVPQPVPPAEAFRRRREKFDAEIARLRRERDRDVDALAAAGNIGQFASGRLRTGTHAGVELMTEPFAIGEKIRAFHNRAANNADFVAPYPPDPPTFPIKELDIVSPALMDRGVHLHGVWYERQLTEHTPSAELLRLAGRGGVRVSFDTHPLRAMSWDGDSAAVIPADRFGAPEGCALVITQPMIADVVGEFIRQQWRRADAWDGHSQPVMGTRHRAVLVLLAEGRTDQAIAHALGLGLRSVRRYVADMCSALGVQGRAALAAEAVRRRIIE
jgi:DNA-binding CsgD family transcriptional regulator